VLHTFYLIGSSLMLFWWSRYRRRGVRRRSHAAESVESEDGTDDVPAVADDPESLTPPTSDAAVAGLERC
jgi:hypothetical protein